MSVSTSAFFTALGLSANPQMLAQQLELKLVDCKRQLRGLPGSQSVAIAANLVLVEKKIDSKEMEYAAGLLDTSARKITGLVTAKAAYDQVHAAASAALAPLVASGDAAAVAQQTALQQIAQRFQADTDGTRAANDATPIQQWAVAQAANAAALNAYRAGFAALAPRLALTAAVPGRGVAAHTLAAAWVAFDAAQAAAPANPVIGQAAGLAALLTTLQRDLGALLDGGAANTAARANYEGRIAAFNETLRGLSDRLRAKAESNLNLADPNGRLGRLRGQQGEMRAAVTAVDFTKAKGLLDAATPDLADLGKVVDGVDGHADYAAAKAEVAGKTDDELNALSTDELLVLGKKMLGAVHFVGPGPVKEGRKRLLKAMKVDPAFTSATKLTAAQTVQAIMANPDMRADFTAMFQAKRQMEVAHDAANPALGAARAESKTAGDELKAKRDLAAVQNEALRTAQAELAAAKAALAAAKARGEAVLLPLSEAIDVADKAVTEATKNAADTDAALRDARTAVRATGTALRAAKEAASVPPEPSEATLAIALRSAIKAANDYCGKLAIPNVPVEIGDKPDPLLGGWYDPNSGKLYVNKRSSLLLSPKDFIDVVLHETTHYYQDQLAKQVTSGTIGPDSPNYTVARIFADNMAPGGYITSEEDDDVYRAQPTEVHAFSVGTAMGKHAFNLKDA